MNKQITAYELRSSRGLVRTIYLDAYPFIEYERREAAARRYIEDERTRWYRSDEFRNETLEIVAR